MLRGLRNLRLQSSFKAILAVSNNEGGSLSLFETEAGRSKIQNKEMLWRQHDAKCHD